MTNRFTCSMLTSSFVWLVACTTDSTEHPPFCNEPRCIPHVATKISGSAGSGGTGEEGASVGGGADATVAVAYAVKEIAESFASQDASGAFELTAPTTGGEVKKMAGLPASSSLTGVLRSASAWLAAKPTSQSPLYPGLVAFDATTGASPLPVEIPLFYRRNLQLVASSLTSLPTLDDTKAQIVLRFIDSDGIGVAGISVAMVGAPYVAYDLAAGYTDDAAATSQRGLAFLLNVDASATPSARLLTLGGVVSGEGTVLVQAGSATVRTIRVAPK